jgi:hypothetical protein
MSTLDSVIRQFNPSTFLELDSGYFNKIGNLRYINKEALVLNRGSWSYFTPYNGWIRYGLDIERFGADKKWIGDKGEKGEWACAFHGLRRNPKDCAKKIIQEGLKAHKGKNSQWGWGSPDIGKNNHFYSEKSCGPGVFLTPKIEYLTQNVENCYLLQPIKYNKFFDIRFIFICRLRPEAIRVPECANQEYYIVRRSEDIRPYGLLVNFIDSAEGEKIRAELKFENLATVQEYSVGAGYVTPVKS